MNFARHNFTSNALYCAPQQEPIQGFLSKRWSFWLALFSCIAFLVGNMVGQHGWQAFWKSVWGKEREIVMEFTGTVPPLPYVINPDYWTREKYSMTYEQIPVSERIPLPLYSRDPSCGVEVEHDTRIYSVRYMGNYSGGGDECGSHVGVDILAPRGTPVVAIANGIIEKVSRSSIGFGNSIVLKIPNAPDSDSADGTTTLFAGYSHLGSMYVEPGQVVYKGEQIAVTGQTGLATAPHIDFQIATQDAPFIPYWAFSTADATREGVTFAEAVNKGIGKKQGLAYTVSPIVFVQKYSSWEGDTGTAIVQGVKKDDIVIATSVVQTPPREEEANNGSTMSVKEKVLSSIRTAYRSRSDQRRSERLARMEERRSQVVYSDPEPKVAAEVVTPVAQVVDTSIVHEVPVPLATEVASIAIVHDGSFYRDWEEIVLLARDADGNFVTDVQFEGDIYLGTGFGDADFSPNKLTAEQFDNSGKARIRMLPRAKGHRAIVPIIGGAFTAQGEPLVFDPSEVVHTALAGE